MKSIKINLMCEDRDNGRKCQFKDMRIDLNPNEESINVKEFIEMNVSLRYFLHNSMIFLPNDDMDTMVGFYPSEDISTQNIPIVPGSNTITLKYQKIQVSLSSSQVSSTGSGSASTNAATTTATAAAAAAAAANGASSELVAGSSNESEWSPFRNANGPAAGTNKDNNATTPSGGADIFSHIQSGDSANDAASVAQIKNRKRKHPSSSQPFEIPNQPTQNQKKSESNSDKQKGTGFVEKMENEDEEEAVLQPVSSVATTASTTSGFGAPKLKNIALNKKKSNAITAGGSGGENNGSEEGGEIEEEENEDNEFDEEDAERNQQQGGGDSKDSSDCSSFTENEPPKVKKQQSGITNDVTFTEANDMNNCLNAISTQHNIMNPFGSIAAAFPLMNSALSASGLSSNGGMNGLGQNNNLNNNSNSRQSRNKERTIMEAIEMVTKWRDLQEDYRQKHQVKGLQEVADELNISKKVLDYYFQELRTAEFFGFDFDNNLGKKMGTLRKYIDEQKKNHEDKNKNFKITRNLQFKYRLKEYVPPVQNFASDSPPTDQLTNKTKEKLLAKNAAKSQSQFSFAASAAVAAAAAANAVATTAAEHAAAMLNSGNNSDFMINNSIHNSLNNNNNNNKMINSIDNSMMNDVFLRNSPYFLQFLNLNNPLHTLTKSPVGSAAASMPSQNSFHPIRSANQNSIPSVSSMLNKVQTSQQDFISKEAMPVSAAAAVAASLKQPPAMKQKTNGMPFLNQSNMNLTGIDKNTWLVFEMMNLLSGGAQLGDFNLEQALNTPAAASAVPFSGMNLGGTPTPNPIVVPAVSSPAPVVVVAPVQQKVKVLNPIFSELEEQGEDDSNDGKEEEERGDQVTGESKENQRVMNSSQEKEQQSSKQTDSVVAVNAAASIFQKEEWNDNIENPEEKEEIEKAAIEQEEEDEENEEEEEEENQYGVEQQSGFNRAEVEVNQGE